MQQHHVRPKSRGGRAVEPVHPICHQAIHAAFTNAELASLEAAGADLAQEPRLRRFIAWVAKRPPDFHAPTRARRQAAPLPGPGASFAAAAKTGDDHRPEPRRKQ